MTVYSNSNRQELIGLFLSGVFTGIGLVFLLGSIIGMVL